MIFLSEMLSGRPGIDLIKEGILESEELCGWMDSCRYINQFKGDAREKIASELCSLDKSQNCIVFKSAYMLLTEKNLKNISRKVADMDCKRAPVFLAKLPSQVYTIWRERALKKGIDALSEENQRCLKKHGCSANEHYDVEHP